MSYSITYSKTSFDDSEPSNVIREMETLHGYRGFVYDLTTENHHFAAGVGSLIVHNTASVFWALALH